MPVPYNGADTVFDQNLKTLIFTFAPPLEQCAVWLFEHFLHTLLALAEHLTHPRDYMACGAQKKV